MSFELQWLIYTILLTSVLWIPYILNRIAVRGLVPALGNPHPEDPPHAPWAQRAINAHKNAVENLVLFAPLALAAHMLQISTPVTRAAVVIYFFARLAHYVVYTTGVPVARTIIFAVGLGAVIALALVLLGVS